MISFLENSRKCNRICSDRKPITGCLGRGGGGAMRSERCFEGGGMGSASTEEVVSQVLAAVKGQVIPFSGCSLLYGS